MRFEVINDENNVVMSTNSYECLPTQSEVNAMIKSRYQIKIDGKIASKKKIGELFLKKKECLI
jgi:hypothetical protein